MVHNPGVETPNSPAIASSRAEKKSATPFKVGRIRRVFLLAMGVATTFGAVGMGAKDARASSPDDVSDKAGKPTLELDLSKISTSVPSPNHARVSPDGLISKNRNLDGDPIFDVTQEEVDALNRSKALGGGDPEQDGGGPEPLPPTHEYIGFFSLDLTSGNVPDSITRSLEHTFAEKGAQNFSIHYWLEYNQSTQSFEITNDGFDRVSIVDLAGNNPLGISIIRLLDHLKDTVGDQRLKIDVLASNWNTPQARVSVLAVLPQDVVTGEETIPANSIFMIGEDGEVIALIPEPGQRIQVSLFNTGLWNWLVSQGFNSLGSKLPRDGENVAMIFNENNQVVSLHFGDRSVHNIDDQPNEVPSPLESPPTSPNQTDQEPDQGAEPEPEPAPVPGPTFDAENRETPEPGEGGSDEGDSESFEGEYSADQTRYITAMKAQSLRLGIDMNEMIPGEDGNQIPRWRWDDRVNAWMDTTTNTWFVPGMATDNLPEGGWDESARLNGEIVYSSSAQASSFENGEGMKFTLNSSKANPGIGGLEMTSDQAVVDLVSEIITTNIPFFNGKHLIINFTHLEDISRIRDYRPNPYDMNWSGNAMANIQLIDNKVVINFGTGRIEQSVGGGFPQGAGVYVIFDAVNRIMSDLSLSEDREVLWNAALQAGDTVLGIATPTPSQ